MSEDRELIKQELLKQLYKLPVHSMTTNKKEISVRCPYCGDSRKSNSSSHLYFNIDTNSDKFLQFYCQRCKTKGFTNSELLRNLSLYDQNLIIGIDKVGKENSKINRKKFRSSIYKRKLKIPVSKDSKSNRLKLAYINGRLGTKLTYEDLPKYKIILSLYDLLDYNKITFTTCKKGMEDTLDSCFIGFVSFDNNYIVMRNLSKTALNGMRYHNYNIFNNYDNTKKFYIVPQAVDVMQLSTTVVITEGIFDLLSVYFNYEEHNNQKIFTSVCGIGYNNVIQELIRLGFLDINLKIYGDNDQDIKLYKNLRSEFSPFINKVELYTNTAYKDFGDVRNPVNIRKSIIV